MQYRADNVIQRSAAPGVFTCIADDFKTRRQAGFRLLLRESTDSIQRAIDRAADEMIDAHKDIECATRYGAIQPRHARKSIRLHRSHPDWMSPADRLAAGDVCQSDELDAKQTYTTVAHCTRYTALCPLSPAARQFLAGPFN